jgi:cystathionine beta-lyase
MHYDFDNPVDRANTGSLKWDSTGAQLPMWVADMDLRTAPEITEALRERADQGVFGYQIVTDEWYQAYILWWRRRYGFDIERQWLVFCTGVVPAISSIVRKMTTPAENVLTLTPVYNIFFNSIENNGRRALECPLIYEDGDYRIDWPDLERKLAMAQTTLMILCNPHNPIGHTWSSQTLERIGELCWKHHVLVLSDEIHCDLTDPGITYTPFASLGEHCRLNCITCIAPTKTFNLAGIQTAAVMIPNEYLRNKVERGLNTDEVAEPNVFAIPAAVAAYSYGSRWLDELRAYLYENKRLVRQYLATDTWSVRPGDDSQDSKDSGNIQDGKDSGNTQGTRSAYSVRAVDSDATYLMWLDCTAILERTGGTADMLCDYLQRTQGLLLSAGGQFRGNGSQFLRLNIACPRRRVMEGLDRLSRGLRSYAGVRTAQ